MIVICGKQTNESHKNGIDRIDSKKDMLTEI